MHKSHGLKNQLVHNAIRVSDGFESGLESTVTDGSNNI
jgi:hypothetical protein